MSNIRLTVLKLGKRLSGLEPLSLKGRKFLSSRGVCSGRVCTGNAASRGLPWAAGPVNKSETNRRPIREDLYLHRTNQRSTRTWRSELLEPRQNKETKSETNPGKWNSAGDLIKSLRNSGLRNLCWWWISCCRCQNNAKKQRQQNMQQLQGAQNKSHWLKAPWLTNQSFLPTGSFWFRVVLRVKHQQCRCNQISVVSVGVGGGPRASLAPIAIWLATAGGPL